MKFFKLILLTLATTLTTLNVLGQDTLYAVVEGWNTSLGNYIITISDVTGIEADEIVKNQIPHTS